MDIITFEEVTKSALEDIEKLLMASGLCQQCQEKIRKAFGRVAKVVEQNQEIENG